MWIQRRGKPPYLQSSTTHPAVTVLNQTVLSLCIAEEMVTSKGGESREFSVCLLVSFWFEIRPASGTSDQVPKSEFCGFTITL